MSDTLQLCTDANAGGLHYDLTERVCNLLSCEVTLKALRLSSRELRSLAQRRVSVLRPKAGQRSGGVDLAVISEKFPCVATLDLRGVAGLVRDDTLAATPRMENLSSLVLDGCRHVTDDGLKQLSTSVQTLSLRHCSQVTWGGLRNLGHLQQLSTLNITGIKLQGATGAPAGPAPQPVGVGQPEAGEVAAAAPAGGHQPGAGAAMGGPGGAQGAAMAPGSFTPDAALCKVLQQLDSLTLGDPMSLSFIADRLVVEGLAAARPLRLSHLDLSGCIDLTDWAVHELCGAMPALTSLSLQSCVRLTNAALLELPRLPGLRQLNLRGCLQLSDAGLAAGLSGLAALELLNLQGCTAVTGSCLVELAPCRRLADLNVSHCAAFSSLEPLRGLGGLRRLAVSHCAKLSVAGITALTALSGLTEVRASHLRNLAAPGANGGPAAALSTEQLAAMSSLSQLQALDLSYFSHPGGFPCGLLDAVAGLTRLTRLCLAGCGGLAADAPAGLGFLSGLRRLEELDLGAWQEVDPQQLTCLAGATALRRLVVSRLGNRHANGCFDGCDCNGSPNSSLAPSLTSSPDSSPDRSEAGAGVGDAGLAPAAAAAAAAERRAAAAAATRAASAALAAAASMVAEAAVAAAVGEDGGEEADRERSIGGESTNGTGTSNSSGGSSEVSDSCRAARRGSRPHRGDSGLQHASSWAVETQAEVDAATAAAAAADATMDALARQMAAVGISCRCGRGCGAAIGAEGASANGSGGASASSVIAAACAAAAAAARAAAAEAELAATSAAAVAAAGARRRHVDDDTADQCAGGAVSGAAAVDAVAHVEGATSGPATADDGALNGALAKVPLVRAPRPFLNLAQDNPSPATGAVLAEAGLPPLAVPLTPRPGLDGALGHLTSLTALTEVHLEACNHVTDVGVSRLARLPRLELLDLGGCNRVTGRTLAAFARAGHGALHTLTLANCVSLNDAGVVALAGVGSLRVVDLAGCSRVTDAGSVALGGLRRLTKLSLRGLAKITDRTVEVLAELPALQSLTLSLCGAITDNALAHLAGQAPGAVHSSGSIRAATEVVTAAAAAGAGAGAAAARALTWLDVSHCWRLSAGGVRKLEAARPQLKVIFTGRR